MYPYKTQPFDHQREILNATATKFYWAWFLEPGTGKTKIAIDNFSYLYLEKKINATLWIAPNGVQDVFAEEQLQIHIPDCVPYDLVVWDTQKGSTKKFQARLEELLFSPKLAIFAINSEAVLSTIANKFILRFLTKRIVFTAVDESSLLATPNSKRTKRIWSFGHRSKFKRIMNGTPAVDGNPLDYYGQMTFLNRKILGFNTFSDTQDGQEGYKSFVADWDERTMNGRSFKTVHINPDGTKAWKNLDVIQERVSKYSTRILKRDVLDLPPKLYAKRKFQLSPEQQRHYDEVQSDYITEFENGGVMTAEKSFVRTMRLQQIACGYATVERIDEPKQIHIIKGAEPRLDATIDLLRDSGDAQTIIWARYHQDITNVLRVLSLAGISGVRYDGLVGENERKENKQAYLSGRARVYVANQKSGGKASTLINTEYVIYYSNYFELEARIQSEDRSDRIGLKHNVLYTDLVAIGTVDETKIIPALINKQNVADVLTGDPKKDWLTQ